ncbi:MAG: response regulator transcription factor [Marivita sp.]|uniref:helix-turn-helix transcriptional regulator n=1 Tax=Marivita sp. TaxID=2003365 RepID=UPI003EF5763E
MKNIDCEISGLDETRRRPATRKPCVIFLGSPVYFSQRLLDTFQMEFDWAEFIRVSNLTELAQLTKGNSNAVLVVIEETRIEALIQHWQVYREAAGKSKIIASYFDERLAAKLFSARSSSDALRQVGFLPLNSQVDVWVSVMNVLLCGEVLVPSELIEANAIPALQDTPNESSDIKLTKREWDVVRLVAAGMQNKNIASELDLSQHTVKLHIHNILKKIGVSNRTCAARWYNTSVLVDPNRNHDGNHDGML